ncbi:granulocyte-macrophage colony-stimulating factor receptor subunit alpha-like isoform X3 [Phycodurus eques]|uniref:granulocyte-macrophage colony-stimulating factor receptor subunit alpha-like isoform X3 n=1 Tax=Phycodurus eques TaxID=693459 RepID=UPI002ACD7DD2|nr:granulocyte-macrophage colony-stimulating factor receptor subunit alpha-like isoform X3 [Phycodurus eques]
MPILAVVVNEPKFPQTLDGTRVTHLTSPFFRKATLSSVKESEGRSTQREFGVRVRTCRSAMKSCRAQALVRCGLLIVAAFQSEAADVDACQGENLIANLRALSSSEADFGDTVYIEENETFNCSLYPNDVLNCSWAFPALPADAQLYVSISICENNGTVRPLRPTSREHSGSASVALREDELLYVTVRFNVSLRQRWVVYGYAYDAEMMEVSPPPGNVRASVRDVDLAVTWDAPRAAAGRHPACFQYQLDVGRQKKWTIRSGELSYTIPNVDRASDLSVRLRARKSAACLGSPSWSRWSNTVTIERSSDPLDITRTVWFALGIPVILVALFCLLRVHRLRVKEVLYPTIPRPPLKYKYFLDENNTFDFYLPATSVKCEEEITVVEDTEKQL